MFGCSHDERMRVIKTKTNMFEVKCNECENVADYIVELDEKESERDITHYFAYMKNTSFFLCSLHYKKMLKDRPDLLFQVI